MKNKIELKSVNKILVVEHFLENRVTKSDITRMIDIGVGDYKTDARAVKINRCETRHKLPNALFVKLIKKYKSLTKQSRIIY